MCNDCVPALDVHGVKELEGVRRKSERVEEVQSMVSVMDVGGENP